MPGFTTRPDAPWCELPKRGVSIFGGIANASGKEAFIKQGRYTHTRQLKRAWKQTRRLRIFLGRVIRDIRRKYQAPDESHAKLLALEERIFSQTRNDTNKVYSVHAPVVECIAKGKAHKRYEFGCKVAMVTHSIKNWVLAIDAPMTIPLTVTYSNSSSGSPAGSHCTSIAIGVIGERGKRSPTQRCTWQAQGKRA